VRSLSKSNHGSAWYLLLRSAIALFLLRGDRTSYNHRIVMVQMDKIVIAKRCWVSLRQTNLQGSAIAYHKAKIKPTVQASLKK